MKKLPKTTLAQKPTYKKIAHDVDFFSLFQKIEREFADCFLFESLGEEGKFARYSLMGFGPTHIISAREKNLFIDGEAYVVANPYYSLREIMPEQAIAREYAGGLVGYLGYDAVNYFEPAVRAKLHPLFPQFMFGVYTDGLVLDKLTNELFYFYYDIDRSDLVYAAIRAKIAKQSVDVSFGRDSLSKEEFMAMVERVKEEICAGNTFQCVVGFKSEYTIRGDALAIYERLRQVNPSPFMYYVKFTDKKIIGASPELLFSLRKGEMVTKPLAGTIGRGKNKKEDKELARLLLNDPKEVAEHTMLVDMHRNDMGRVAQFGTVRVRDLLSIKRFSHVQHISSEVSGLLHPREDMFSALASNFPMGTLCGVPKVETLKIMEANEPHPRGPYTGGVGHFGFTGDCTFAGSLRSLYLDNDYLYAQAGAGIVYDSLPDKEYEEVQRKLAATKRVLSEFQLAF